MNSSLNYSFPKSRRLLNPRDFHQVKLKGQRRVGTYLTVEFKHAKHSTTRLGIIVSRKYGDSVKRNRFKRLLREAFRLSQHTLPPALDIVVKPRQAALEAGLEDIQSELIGFFKEKDKRQNDLKDLFLNPISPQNKKT